MTAQTRTKEEESFFSDIKRVIEKFVDGLLSTKDFNLLMKEEERNSVSPVIEQNPNIKYTNGTSLQSYVTNNTNPTPTINTNSSSRYDFKIDSIPKVAGNNINRPFTADDDEKLLKDLNESGVLIGRSITLSEDPTKTSSTLLTDYGR